MGVIDTARSGAAGTLPFSPVETGNASTDPLTATRTLAPGLAMYDPCVRATIAVSAPASRSRTWHQASWPK